MKYIDNMNDFCVMEMFYDILSNKHKPQPLNEKTLNRIFTKHKECGFVVVSANRTDKDSITNNKNTKKCIQTIKNSGYSYFPVYGGYHDKDNNIKDTYEPSFFITNFKKGELQNFDELKDLAIKLCKDFEQDSVLIVEPNGEPKYYNENGKVIGTQNSDNVSFNRLEKEFFTALSKKTNGTQRFSFDMKFESIFVNPLPCTLNEKIRRISNNEIIINVEND